MGDTGQRRAVFDAEISFTNGGALTTRGFRLDIPEHEVTDEQLGELLVRQLGLLMVDEVKISGKTVLREAHKGTRGVMVRHQADQRMTVRPTVELSHEIRHGMVTYPGLPGPEITDHLARGASPSAYAPGTEFHIARISMVATTGTYLDTPSHRFADGADLAAVALSRLADLDGVVVRLVDSQQRAVDRLALAPHDVTGRAVLIHTGWDRHWGSDSYASEYPYLTASGAAWLVEQGAMLLGIDSLNVDDNTDGDRPVHTTLLAAGIPIVEHLCGLDQLPADGFRFHAAPPLVRGMGTFPVRAYAVLEPVSSR